MYRLGYLRLERGEHRATAEAFHACVEKRPDWPEAQLNLGLACWNMGDLEGASKAFEGVLTATRIPLTRCGAWRFWR